MFSHNNVQRIADYVLVFIYLDSTVVLPRYMSIKIYKQF